MGRDRRVLAGWAASSPRHWRPGPPFRFQSPGCRDDKARTTAEMLPELLVGHQGRRLVARSGNLTIDGRQAVLVSNNETSPLMTGRGWNVHHLTGYGPQITVRRIRTGAS